MELILRSTSKKIRKKVERNFKWYNSYTGETWEGTGGEMRFRYDPSLMYSIPYLVDAEELILTNNYDDIIDWVKKNKFLITDQVAGNSVTIEVPDSDSEEIKSKLYEKRIVFDSD